MRKVANRDVISGIPKIVLVLVPLTEFCTVLSRPFREIMEGMVML
jgi:hypothetical protein